MPGRIVLKRCWGKPAQLSFRKSAFEDIAEGEFAGGQGSDLPPVFRTPDPVIDL
jgi:hypothetical protein